MKKMFLVLAALVALTVVSCVRDESTYFHVTDVKGVVINEVYTFSDQSEADDLDWIELYNTTDEDIDLTDVLMWEGGGSEEAWKFPAGSIIPAKGHFVVDCDKYGLLSDPVKYPAWGLSKGPDEFVVLANSDLSVIDEIALPSMNENESYGRVTDGASDWQIFQQATYGVKNEGPARGVFVNTTGLYINEVYTDNSDVFTASGWDPSVDFIEFYNATDADIDMSGYKVYDDKHEEETSYVFPSGTVVPAKGFLTFDVYKENPAGPAFGLGAGGDWVFLYDTAGEKVDEIEIPSITKESGNRDKGYTFGRKPDGSTVLVWFTAASKNASNNNSPVLEGSEQPSDPEQPSTGGAKVVLNELCGNKVEYDSFASANKFIELYNAGDAEADLAGWQMFKNNETEAIWTAPAGTKLAPGAYLVLEADATDPAVGFNAGLSAKKEVKIELKDASGKSVDVFCRGVDATPMAEETLAENKEASFSRVPNGNGDWAYAVPTPGAANGTSTGEIEGYTPSEQPSDPEQPSTGTAKVVLNELCGNKVEYDSFASANKFIELYNAGDAEADLAGWQMFKNNEDESVWTAPAGTKLAPGAYLVLEADATDPAVGFNAGFSAKKEVKIELKDASGKSVDVFCRGVDATPMAEETLAENKEASFSRVPNGNGEWAYAVPTPGAANGASTGAIEGM